MLSAQVFKTMLGMLSGVGALLGLRSWQFGTPGVATVNGCVGLVVVGGGGGHVG